MTTLTFDLDGAPRIGLAECKANLSSIVMNVEDNNEPLVMMRYGKPAALIVPFPKTPAARSPKARGILAEIADEKKRELESSAFANAMVAKHVRQ